MSLWTKIETAPASAAWFSWKLRFGKELPKARALFLKQKLRERAGSVPCPRHCGCPHVMNEENYGVCNCGDCEPILLTAKDVEVWQPNWISLGSKVRDGFDLEHKACEFPVAMVWQVGSFGGGALPIILIVQPDRVAFNEAIAQLVARVPGGFVVLTPTSEHHDIESRELLGRVHAGLHDLESNMTLLPSGDLSAIKSADELFSPYLPDLTSRRDGGARPAARFLFRPAGSVCEVVFDGSNVFHINNTDGAKYLNYLLHHPNELIRAFELEAKVKPEKAAARAENSVQTTVDARAKREARKELVVLHADLEAAEAEDDLPKVKRLKDEIAKVRAVAGNDSLLDADTGEKARDNVRKAIEKVLNKLRKGGKDEKAFEQHLVRFVPLGYELIYNQAEGNIWA